MTEAEWLAATDSATLISGLQDVPPCDRKLRLFRVACCRHFWDRLTIKPARDAVKVAELYADLAASDDQLAQAYQEGFRRFFTYSRMRNIRAMTRNDRLEGRITMAGFAVDTASGNLRGMLSSGPDDIGGRVVKQTPSTLTRCIFGNPFRPVAVEPHWVTTTVLTLAEAIYADRAFDRLPILADALEEAGCDNADVLAHCRGDGPHARGCWVVDLVLGQS